MITHTAFVPNGESRRDTARLLVDLADEHGIDQRSIKAANGGFQVTDEIADLLGDDLSEETTVGDIAADALDEEAPLDPNDEGDGEDEEEEAEEVDYSTWEYKDLKAEVARRDLAVEDQRGDTLAAALQADDADVESA